MTLKNSQRSGSRSTSQTVQKLNTELSQLKSELESLNDNNNNLSQELVLKSVKTFEMEALLQEKTQDINALRKLKDKQIILEKNEQDLDEKLLTLYEYIEKLSIKNIELISENKKLSNEIYKVENENFKVKSKLEDVKHHLSYTLGTAIVSTKPDVKEFFKIPKKIINSYKKYYDYQILKNNAVSNEEDFAKVKSEHDMVAILPLRFGEKEIILDSKYLKNNKFIKVSSNSLRPNSFNDIQLEIKVIHGEFKAINKTDREILNLKKGDLFKFKFSIQDGADLELFECIEFTEDLVLSLKWAKKTGKAVILQLIESDSINIETKVKVKEKINYKLPNSPRNDVLLKASEIAIKYGNSAAFDYYEKCAKVQNKKLIHVLRANLFHKDSKVWLEEVNLFLESKGVDRILLNNETESGRYLNIESEKKAKCKSDFLVSVIMPAFNAEKTILKSINSILNQTWENLELIVVNDCSTDDTLKILQSIKDTRLIIINNVENVGAYVSKNIALRATKGKYITGHDADDWALPRRLENHILHIKKSNNPRASLTKMIRMDKNGYFSHIGREGLFCEDGAIRIASITCMFERDFLINQLGAWDSVRMGADSEIIARAKILLSDEFKTFDLLSMICLDAEGSLTNDPIHGVSKETGLSDTRKNYKKSWLKWHEQLAVNKLLAKVEFPQIVRNYEIPLAMNVDTQKILKNLE